MTGLRVGPAGARGSTMHDEMLAMGFGDPLPVTVDAGPLGEFAVTDPTVDLNSDGVLDTATFVDSGGVTVASDLDGDGSADHLTRVEGDGDYAAWEPRRAADGTVHWSRIDAGRL
ncbi:DUF6802 family protein [Rhodococcus sp. NPDC058505]|uniref:DUF6802 family protein n=1 Tax=unclassified Rhodococcus (in: high G+C Gram-positive bacteria) TaxID=192944 RepID=UPI0036494459